MTDFKCEYHPSRNAVEKCVRCHRLICLEDKNFITGGRSYNHRLKSGFSTYHNFFLCPLCFYDSTVEGVNLIDSTLDIQRKVFRIVPLVVLAFPIFFFVLFSRIAGIGFGELFGGFWFILFLPFFFAALIFLSLSSFGQKAKNPNSGHTVQAAKTAKNRLLESMDAKTSKSVLSRELTCANCAETIEIDSLFCMHCGIATHKGSKH